MQVNTCTPGGQHPEGDYGVEVPILANGWLVVAGKQKEANMLQVCNTKQAGSNIKTARTQSSSGALVTSVAKAVLRSHSVCVLQTLCGIPLGESPDT